MERFSKNVFQKKIIIIWFIFSTFIKSSLADAYCATNFGFQQCYGITAYCCNAVDGCCYYTYYSSWWFWTPFSIVSIITICLLFKFCCNYQHRNENEETITIYNHRIPLDVNNHVLNKPSPPSYNSAINQP